MKLLLIGDMHVKKENIEESNRLIDWIIDVCLSVTALPVFVGDQYDTMAIKRIEVEEFWHFALKKIKAKLMATPIMLTGNHDINSDGTASALTVHEDNALVVGSESKFMTFERNATQVDAIGLLSYIRDNDKFIEEATRLYNQGARVILCHAEFNGAEYENGFYAPHGIDLEKCPPVLFISGHIHKMQKLSSKNGAQVMYIGTPRHLTRSDAGQKKGVWVYDNGLSASGFHPTPSSVAEPFTELHVVEGGEFVEIPKEHTGRLYVDVKGSKEFVDGVLKRLPEGVKVRTFVESQAVQSEIKESEGVEVAFQKFLNKYFEASQIPEASRQAISQELLGGIK